MKKPFLRTFLLLIMLFLIFISTACKLLATDEFDVKSEYDTAINNMLNSDLYYWKETNISASTYREANVMAKTDRHFEPLISEHGIYDDLRIYALEKQNGKAIFELWCGISEGINKSDNGANYLFEKYYENDGKAIKQRVKREEEPNAFYHSTGFEKYRLENVLSELTYLQFEDMDFDAIDETNGKALGKKKKLGAVTSLEFAPTAEYLERYEREHGKPSMFANALKLEVEITYENISKLAIYKASSVGTFSIDEESYRIEIIYDAEKKINMPSYNETDWMVNAE